MIHGPIPISSASFTWQADRFRIIEWDVPASESTEACRSLRSNFRRDHVEWPMMYRFRVHPLAMTDNDDGRPDYGVLCIMVTS